MSVASRQEDVLHIGLDANAALVGGPVTGVQSFAYGILAHLPRLAGPDCRWTLFLPQERQLAAPLPEGIDIRRPSIPLGRLTSGSSWFAWRFFRDQVDLRLSFVHSKPGRGHKPQLVTVHDTLFDEFPEAYPAKWAEAMLRDLRQVRRLGARVLVPSRDVAQKLVNRHQFDPRRVHVTGCGAAALFRPGPSRELPEWLRQAGIAQPFFLAVGRQDLRKNFHLVVEAYRRLLSRGEKIGGLVLVGPEDTGTPLLRAIMEKGPVPGERIFTTGFIPEERLVALNRCAVGLVFPSRGEGFGIPILEAMACGTPVITSNVSAMPEVAGDAALLIDSNDVEGLAAAMARLLSEKELVESLSQAGLARAREFSWEQAARRVLEAIEESKCEMRPASR